MCEPPSQRRQSCTSHAQQGRAPPLQGTGQWLGLAAHGAPWALASTSPRAQPWARAVTPTSGSLWVARPVWHVAIWSSPPHTSGLQLWCIVPLPWPAFPGSGQPHPSWRAVTVTCSQLSATVYHHRPGASEDRFPGHLLGPPGRPDAASRFFLPNLSHPWLCGYSPSSLCQAPLEGAAHSYSPCPPPYPFLCVAFPGSSCTSSMATVPVGNVWIVPTAHVLPKDRGWVSALPWTLHVLSSPHCGGLHTSLHDQCPFCCAPCAEHSTPLQPHSPTVWSGAGDPPAGSLSASPLPILAPPSWLLGP